MIIFNFLTYISFSVFTIVLVLYLYAKHSYRYWKKHGIPYIEPSFPSGNFEKFLYQKLNLGDACAELYQHFKKIGAKFGGIWVCFEPVVVAVDREFLKQVFVADFKHFTDHAFYVDEERDPLSAHLFAIKGQKWRNLRVKLSPTFTTGRIKLMFPIVERVTDRLVKVLGKYADTSEPVDIQEITTRFSTDTIASCAYGLECNSLEDAGNEFLRNAKRLFEVQNLSDHIRRLGVFTFPSIISFFGITFAPKEVNKFFINTVRDVVEYREKNRVLRNDFMQLLIQLKNEGILKDVDDDIETVEDSPTDAKKLTLNEIAAQCLIIFIGGFDTSSSTLAFLFYEIAKNQSIQDKLRDEIVNVTKDYEGRLIYESVSKMTYLDMVINETLRKYSVLPLITRTCTEDYPVPDSNYTIKKGQKVFISVSGIHKDPEYYPVPERFDPERFSEENRASTPPFAYVPFGDGPRVCIGKRFGFVQIRLAVCKILTKYKVILNPKTVEPVRVEPISMVDATPHTDIILNFVKIN